MKKLIILKGVSSPEKTTKAKELALAAYKRGTNAVICSVDDHFADVAFDENKLQEALDACKIKAEKHMKKNSDGPLWGLVIINLEKDYQIYLDLAEQYRYIVEEVVL